ncbi:MAG TPA: K(+)-transporting ATPase subunit F [Acidobacteriaceae bacterium]
MARDAPRSGEFRMREDIVLLAVSFAVLVYLVYALLRPEKL